MPHHHTTFEHDLFDNLAPSPHHLHLLTRLTKQSTTKLLDIDYINGRPRLRATHHVGLLQLADLSLQILPKMHRRSESNPQVQQREATRNLLTLLSYALELPLHDHHAATQTHQPHDWLDLLTRLFAADLLHQLHHAPHRAYTTIDDEFPLLRGKLRIADQLRRPDRQHRFACTFDEFSLDNPLNRVFRFVIHHLLPLTARSSTRQQLTTLRDLLDDVSLPAHLTPADADPQRLLTRLNRRYLPALTLARLFLSRQTPALSHGPLHTFNFLFNMNTLFESFLAGFLQKHGHEILHDTPLEHATITTQSPRLFLAHDSHGKPHFQLHPDLVFTRGHTHPLILDTKYKHLHPTAPRFGISPADFYQMLAYAHRYHCPHILLLYPQTADTPTPLHESFTIENTPTTITAATIDVTRDLRKPGGIEKLIGELRDLVATPPLKSTALQP